MSSIFIVLFGLVGFTFGWFVYSKFIAEKIYRLDPNYETPAHKFNDGVDYVPTNKFVLWGSHFTAVAGAAPIAGPKTGRRARGARGAVATQGALRGHR